MSTRQPLYTAGCISFGAVYDAHGVSLAEVQHGQDTSLRIGEAVFVNHKTRKNLKHASAGAGGLKMSVASVLSPDNKTDGFPDHLQYVGISRSDYNHKSDSAPTLEQGVVVQCGGLATIKVDDDVFVGDVVCALLPGLCPTTGKVVGKPKARIMARTGEISLSESRLDKVRMIGHEFGNYPDQGICQLPHFPIVGRCVSNGRKGKTADVVLSANASGLLRF
jgi:hypothetical protein